jgi:SAM-dependent methyltransferase
VALVALADVLPLLSCPRCGHPLVVDTRDYRCGASSCSFSERAFPQVDRWPVLVDFERSIVEMESLRTSVGGARARAGPWTGAHLPNWLRSTCVKPPNRIAAANVQLLLSLLPDCSPLILVIGGGTVGNGVESLYADNNTRVLAFDIYASPLTQFIADAHQIPLASASVDAVLIQAVLEHVLDPADVVAEVHRVLKPGGLVYAETPFLQQVHAGAHDFVRYTSSGHRYLFRAFEEIAAGPVAGPGTELLWSVDHLVRGLLRSELAGKVARLLVFWLRYLDRLIPMSFAMDSASAYYFLGRTSEHQLSPQEILHYYRGAQQTLEPGRSGCLT